MRDNLVGVSHSGTSLVTSLLVALVTCTKPGNGPKLAFYHWSKAGGTSIHAALGNPAVPGLSLLTRAGQARYIGQAENHCLNGPLETPMRVRCKLSKTDIFVIANIRSPFGFYASLWRMTTDAKPSDYCAVRTAAALGLHDIFDRANQNNQTTFNRFLYLWLITLRPCINKPGRHPSACTLQLPSINQSFAHCAANSFSSIHHTLQFDIGRPDAIVRFENFDADFHAALLAYEKRSPGSVNFTRLRHPNVLPVLNVRPGILRRAEDCDESRGGLIPHYCLYSAASIELIYAIDGDAMRFHGYSWDSFLAAEGPQPHTTLPSPRRPRRGQPEKVSPSVRSSRSSTSRRHEFC